VNAIQQAKEKSAAGLGDDELFRQRRRIPFIVEQRTVPEAAAIAVIYIVLGCFTKLHPSITILSSLPSAGVGALLALLVCHMELSLVALIGIILADRDRGEKRDHDD